MSDLSGNELAMLEGGDPDCDLRDAALPQLPAATAREIRRERKAGRLVLK